MKLLNLDSIDCPLNVSHAESIDRGIYFKLHRKVIWEVYFNEDKSGDPILERFSGDVLEPTHFYLIETQERISVPNNVAGIMSTESRHARAGLDCLNSSTFVAPGFGKKKMAPLILEIRPKIKVWLPEKEQSLVKALFFEFDFSIPSPRSNQFARFPLR